ncbi:DUF4381 domain-containing protein [Vibrio mediterranei]|uniref:DUF4381 domain-containing protein n=1 Tax=Vibrio mediterranei TaxID=689 RepID=UPI001EFD4AFD|nr:DUF4381 domain-containing protein [Vibrio mediterranei]MCG9628358.1 DUF4381 domain-containing protein [Vibrio mediterranei]
MSQLSQPQTLPLKPLHLPVEPSVWPLPWGYWALLGFIVLSIILTVLLIRRKRNQERAKKAALKMLTSDVSTLSPAEANEILRQAALSYFPRKEVANLTGQSWLSFLDSQLASPRFLANESSWHSALYTSAYDSKDEGADLISDCKYWVQNALPPKRKYRNWNAAS